MNDFAEQRASNLPPSLTRQLIAYIGNKRRLLPFLAPILAQTAGVIAGRRGAAFSGGISFLDPMCGSGSVARLARHLGFTVYANDWEDFAWAVTAPYLENNPDTVDRAFSAHGGIQAVLDRLNEYGWEGDRGVRHTGIGQVDERRPAGYIATHFAPASTAQPRLGYERLFYTAENAQFIDRVRDRIDEWFPAGQSPDGDRGRRILIALLVYEASNHANTSGVFKAYHRGFGGHGRDALSRILAKMELEAPAIDDGPIGEAFSQDAAAFVAGRTGDICYLDPPYNSHQYGSNYFMLNTIARWDKPEVSKDRDADGNLLAKAGIRPDWTTTRSAFCYRASAAAALSELVDRIDAGVIVVSYSESGVISAESMADLLAAHGDLSLRGVDYTAYRGGRQSMTRANLGRELAFVVNRRSKSPPGGPGDTVRRRNESSSEIRRQLAEWEVRSLLNDRYVPERLRTEFEANVEGFRLADEVWVGTTDFYRLETAVDLSALDIRTLTGVSARLKSARCEDHAEEFRVLLEFMRSSAACRADRRYQARLLTCLRKFAHRKYRDEFLSAIADLKLEVERHPTELHRVADGLESITEQARLRFGL